jgi:serine phosphatase RsbU (regulator of sigma subunit)/uncharacterized protein HemY
MKNVSLLFAFLFILTCHLTKGQDTDSIPALLKDAEKREKITTYLKQSKSQIVKTPEKSVRSAKKALTLIKNSKKDSLLPKAYYLLGYAHYNQNNFDSALEYFTQSVEYSRKLEQKSRHALAINRLGNTYQLMGSYDKALNHYQQALKINKEQENKKEIARSLTNIGSVYRTFGKYEKAIQFHLKALSLFEKTKAKDGVAWTSLNIARLFKLNEAYDKALEYLNKSMELYQSIAEETGVQTGITLCLKEYGLIYVKSGDLDKALKYSRKALKRNEQNNNKYGIANSYANVGRIYYKKAEYTKSLEYLQKALELKYSLGDKVEVPSLLRKIGENYLKLENYEKAKEFVEKSLQQAKKEQLKEEQKESYRTLASIYQKQNKPAKALNNYIAFSKLKDSLANQRINELEMQYEFEKKQKRLEYKRKQEAAKQQAKLKRQRLITYSLIAGFILLGLLFFVIYISYRRKVRDNLKLEQKNEEIQTQRDEIEAQRDTATQQRDQIARQNRIITESIEYASRIQSAVLPQEQTIQQYFPYYFIFYQPKNIVSGDFYWISQIDGKVIIAAADCTGHGVPGAFMSMLGVAFLNEIINQSKIVRPDEILNQLRSKVIDALHQSAKKRGARDGMDISLSMIDKQSNKMHFAGAYNPLYLIRDHSIQEIKADRMPIGVHSVYQDTPFSVDTIELKKGDCLYLFSDGYFDQFGGKKGNKFSKKAFKDMLLKIHKKPMETQKQILNQKITEWKGDRPQIDDIMVLGFYYDKTEEQTDHS